VDLKKLQNVFIDEAMERAVAFEEGLLRLEKEPGNEDLVNSVFRDIHTIKGSSATLGFSDIAEFTHVMEEILDLVRQDELVPEKELINVLLETTDRIKEMVEALASETLFDFSICENLTKRMEILKNKKVIKEFKIVFIPDPDILKKGMDPVVIIENIKELGEVTSIIADMDAVPALPEIDPEKLYARWEILLKTESDVAEIKEVFEFVEEGSEIKITPIAASEEDVPAIGRMLVQEGVVSADDVNEAIKTQKRLGEILVEQGNVSQKDIENVVEKQSQKRAELFKSSVSSTIRVDLKKLDHLVNIVGEMVIIHSMFHQQAIQGSGCGKSERMDVVLSQLQRIGKDIQESTMSLRMLPVGEVFSRFTRLVRELSGSKNKSIELVISGEETELDKGVLEKITDPLVHLIRNAIDHGIETGEERAARGKSTHGTIRFI